jgi:hypothetical protein
LTSYCRANTFSAIWILRVEVMSIVCNEKSKAPNPHLHNAACDGVGLNLIFFRVLQPHALGWPFAPIPASVRHRQLRPRVFHREPCRAQSPLFDSIRSFTCSAVAWAYSRHSVSHIGQLPCGMGFTHSSFTLRNCALSVPRFIRQLRNTAPLRTCGNIIAGNRLPDSKLLATVPAA